MSTPPELIAGSKWLCWALRHDPTAAGLVLDPQGWAELDDVLAAAARHDHPLTPAELKLIVTTSDKQRFALSDDGRRIRANQGHSVTVDLGLVPQVPPEVLYHGTAECFVAAILSEGLRRGARQHVHLSADQATASSVGVRHARLVLLTVAAARMHADRLPFFRSTNGVWLADAVPPEYLARLVL